MGQLLRQLGFQMWQKLSPVPSLSLVMGTWKGLTGEQFSFQYAHTRPVAWAACSMGVRAPSALAPAVYFANTQVYRLKDVRLLVIGNDALATARQRLAAAAASFPTHS